MNWLTKDWAFLVAQKISKTYKQLMQLYKKKNKTKTTNARGQNGGGGGDS